MLNGLILTDLTFHSWICLSKMIGDEFCYIWARGKDVQQAQNSSADLSSMDLSKPGKGKCQGKCQIRRCSFSILPGWRQLLIHEEGILSRGSSKKPSKSCSFFSLSFNISFCLNFSVPQIQGSKEKEHFFLLLWGSWDAYLIALYKAARNLKIKSAKN